MYIYQIFGGVDRGLFETAGVSGREFSCECDEEDCVLCEYFFEVE